MWIIDEGYVVYGLSFHDILRVLKNEGLNCQLDMFTPIHEYVLNKISKNDLELLKNTNESKNSKLNFGY